MNTQVSGTITEAYPDLRIGFITTPEGWRIGFHFDAFLSGEIPQHILQSSNEEKISYLVGKRVVFKVNEDNVVIAKTMSFEISTAK